MEVGVELFSKLKGAKPPLLSSFVEDSEEEEEGEGEEGGKKDLLRASWLPLESPSAQLARCTIVSDLPVDIIDFEFSLPRLLHAPISSPNLQKDPIVSSFITTKRRLCFESTTITPESSPSSSLIPSSPTIPSRYCNKLQRSSSPLKTFSNNSNSNSNDKNNNNNNSSNNSNSNSVTGANFPSGIINTNDTDMKSTVSRQISPNLSTFTHWSRREKVKQDQNFNLSTIKLAKKMRRATTTTTTSTSTTSEFSTKVGIESLTPSSGEISSLLCSSIGVSTFYLPCFDSPKDAIKRISPNVMAKVLTGEFNHLHSKLLIVDCRYPYEYHGGHLPGAINICSLDVIDQMLFSEFELSKASSTIIIFHCEFSSERAPRMALHVRNLDRALNAENYPSLYYSQIYILDGGYKNFFLQFPEKCEPIGQYVPMRNAGHRDELRHHQRIKLQEGHSHGKHRHKLRSCSLRKSHSIAMPHPASAISSFFRTRELVACSNFASTSTSTSSTSISASKASSCAVIDMLSSDLGDICDQADGILRAAENVLLITANDDNDQLY